ncbi:MAG: hypothetical protein V5A46_01085 [Haloferacaceae archaeon]
MTRAHVALADGLVVVENVDSPAEANPESRLNGERAECVAVSPSAPERVFAGTFEAGLWRSTDGGNAFEPIGDAIGPEAVTAVAVSPHDPDTVIAGTEPSRLYRSDDGGETWRRLDGLADLPSAEEWSFPPRPHTHHVRWIGPSSTDPETWYVGVEAGALVVTRDGGRSWQDRPPGSRRDVHTIATHPDAPDRVYCAAGDGYAESDDGGRTWGHLQQGLEHRYCWGLAVDPGDPDRVIVSTAHGARDAHRTGPSYLYRKRSGKRSASDAGGGRDGPAWERLDDVAVSTGEGATRAVLAAGTEPGELYAACEDGLYRTGDGGDSWTACRIGNDDLGNDPIRGLAVG